MRRMISHGTGEQMLEAFEHKLNMLENSDKPVESATSIEAAVQKPKKATHGTAEQMLAAFEKKIDELEGNVDAASKIEAADEIEEDIVEYLAPDDEERYIHTLIGDTNSELEDLDIFDSWTWEEREDDLILTTVSGSEVEEYTIPKADLKFDWDNMEEDVQYIIQAITEIEMSDGADADETIESAEDVVGATINNDSIDDKSVVIPESAKNEFYADSQGSFGGDESDIYSLEDIMIMWNSDHSSDPSMEMYDSFEEWWEDTERWMKKVTSPGNEEDDVTYVDIDGVFGEPDQTVSKREMRRYWEANYDSDPSLTAFDSFEDWWAETEPMLQPIETATDIQSSDGHVYIRPADYVYRIPDIGDLPEDVMIDDYDIDGDDYIVELDRALTREEMKKYNAKPERTPATIEGAWQYDEDEEPSQYTEIASKSVPDSDGFYTDYTMYRNTETGEYVFVFGDKDIYTPDQEDFDWSCDTEEEAWDWYNDYTGFSDDQYDESYFVPDEESVVKTYNNYSDPAESNVNIPNKTKGYNPNLLQELVNEYSSLDSLSGDYMTLDEIWDEIVDKYGDEDLANDVLEAIDPESAGLYGATALYQNPYDEDEEVDEEVDEDTI